MLNTDAHNPSVKRKMSFDDFRRAYRLMDAGAEITDAMLRQLYSNIQGNRISGDVEASVVTFFNARHEGELGKRSSGAVKHWAMRYFVLSDHCLYYFNSREVCVACVWMCVDVDM